MSSEFRELLKKIGSGTHTHKNLTRQQASIALDMMLTGKATPAQIGAFLLAHRIKRPTGEELAGMLDTYTQRGVKLTSIDDKKEVVIMGIPYDGRSRTAPISPITSLILSIMGVPVLMHGGRRMPTKYGLNLAEIWTNLGLNVTNTSLDQVQFSLAQKNFGFLYLPTHFPLADNFVAYREEIGKRPPVATLELIWQPYQGKSHIMAGYVHPPTEKMIREALSLTGVKKFTLIKGLEGSGDLKLEQTNIIAIDDETSDTGFRYLKLNPLEYDLKGDDYPLISDNDYFEQLHKTLKGENTPLTLSGIWNGGFYLWRCGVVDTMEMGLRKAEELINHGELYNYLNTFNYNQTK